MTNFTNFRFLFIAAAAVWLSVGSAWAQDSRIIIVNGGRYESAPPFIDSVTVGYWDETANRHVLVDKIDAQSVVDAITVSDTLFVATDFYIRSYKLPAFDVLATSPRILGTRKLAKHGSKLFASRGFGTPTGGAYLVGLNANTLAVQDSITGIRGDLEHLLVDGNTLYAGQPGPFGADTAAILVIDPVTMTITRNLSLGTAGAGISKLINSNGNLYGLSTIGFGAPRGALVSFNATSATVTPTTFSVGYTVREGNQNFIGQLGPYSLAAFNPGDTGLASSPRYTPGVAAIAYDRRSESYIATSADYISPATAFKFNSAGEKIDSLTVGLAPEAIVVWVGQVSAVNEESSTKLPLIYPQPATVHINMQNHIAAGYITFEILDAQGRIVLKAGRDQELSIAALSSGVYQLRSTSATNVLIQKLIKQ